jgi:aspartate/methionine/tyrosine aminotransferase
LDYKVDLEEKLQKEVSKKLNWSDFFDKKFCYTLLAKTQICVVPLSSFNSSYLGFRMTLLENDFEKYCNTLRTIKDFILKYRK